MPFENFDFSNFWDDCEWARKAYIHEPPTDELIAEIEAELGYKLPESYIWLMKQHNGGVPVKTCFCVENDVFEVAGILGIGSHGEHSPHFSITDDIISEWGYPNIGVPLCNCPSAGHDMIFLDYRECGPQGEPQVVHIDQEVDYRITFMANNFEEFIRGLGDDPYRLAAFEKVRTAKFSPLLSELCQKTNDPIQTEQWIRKAAEELVDHRDNFIMCADEHSMLLYDIQFLLYTNAYPDTTERQYLENYEKIIALGVSFEVEGNAPAFIKKWQKKQNEKGLIFRTGEHVSMQPEAQKRFADLFSTQGYDLKYLKDWLAQRKREGIIVENNGIISMTDEAKQALLDKRNNI